MKKTLLRKLSAVFLIWLTFVSSLAVEVPFAQAVPLDNYQTFVGANPLTSRRGQWTQLLARGTGTNDFYVLEVDPTTGALPVSGTIIASNPSVSDIGLAVPTSGTYVAGINPSGDLTGFSVDASGYLNVLTTPVTADFGATTAAQRTASVLGNSTGELDYNAGNASAQTPRVVIATDQAALPVSQSGTWAVRAQDGSGNALTSTTGALDVNVANTSIVVTATDLDIRDLTSVTDSVSAVQSGTWNINNISGTVSLPTGAATEATVASLATEATASAINGKIANDYGVSTGAVRTAAQIGNASGEADFGSGAATAQTIRVVPATNFPNPVGRTYADSARLSYTSSNVTTGAWVQVTASTAAQFNAVTIFSSCGSSLELGIGASSSETRTLIVPPGGLDGQISLYIASGTRLSLRSLDTSCTSGEFLITGYN